MIAYLDKHHPPIDETYWIDIEMVGTGNIGYATKHGISYLTEYHPAKELKEYAKQTANIHPELSVTGRDMLILEEVPPLRMRGYNTLYVLGYDKEGYLPN